MRSFLGKELDEIALSYHPHPVRASEFVEELMETLPSFLDNMKSLKIDDQKKYPEDWMATFLAWSEFNTRDIR